MFRRQRCLLRREGLLRGPPHAAQRGEAARGVARRALAPESVWSLQSAANPEYIQFHLGFANDGMAMIDVAASLPSGGDYFSLTMIGGTGAAYADDHHNMNLLYSGGQPNAIRASQGRADLVRQLQEFVDAISEQRAPSVTVADTTRAVEVLDQVLESAKSRQVISGKEGN